jgi:TPR repeat protein
MSSRRDPEAIFELGLRHETRGRPKAAFECFKEAAERRCGMAIFHLARCHEGSIGTEESMNEAFRLYERAARKFGVVLAMKRLAALYHGRVCMLRHESERYTVGAFEFLVMAAKHGDSHSVRTLVGIRQGFEKDRKMSEVEQGGCTYRNCGKPVAAKKSGGHAMMCRKHLAQRAATDRARRARDKVAAQAQWAARARRYNAESDDEDEDEDEDEDDVPLFHFGFK